MTKLGWIFGRCICFTSSEDSISLMFWPIQNDSFQFVCCMSTSSEESYVTVKKLFDILQKARDINRDQWLNFAAIVFPKSKETEKLLDLFDSLAPSGALSTRKWLEFQEAWECKQLNDERLTSENLLHYVVNITHNFSFLNVYFIH